MQQFALDAGDETEALSQPRMATAMCKDDLTIPLTVLCKKSMGTNGDLSPHSPDKQQPTAQVLKQSFSSSKA